MAETKKDTSSKRWYLQDQNRERYAGISADGTIPEVDREALHRLISVKLAATGFEVPETSTRDEGVMQLASDLFRQYAEQVRLADDGRRHRRYFLAAYIVPVFGYFRLAGSRSIRRKDLLDSISFAVAQGQFSCSQPNSNSLQRQYHQ